MKSKFKLCDRETMYAMPESVQDWLPEDHMARFLVEIVEKLDLSMFEKRYSELGRKAYPIDVMVGLLFYAYSTGIFSSRKIELATYEHVPARFIAGNLHPDHSSISGFRKEFRNELSAIFLQILQIASNMGFLKVGNVATDGTKIKANASKHKALSYEHAHKLRNQLKQEVDQLIKMAESADTEIPQGMNIPEELLRREDRIQVIEAAIKEIEAREQKRFESEQAEYKEKMDERKQYEDQTGKKKAGKAPKAPMQGPKKHDQVNLTDSESRIMPVSGGGFEQAYNAQISLDMKNMLIVTNHVTQQTNDKLELAQTLELLKATQEAVNQKCENLCADAGYFSEHNVRLSENSNIAPLIPNKRDKHNKSLTERFEVAGEMPESLDSVSKMKHQLKTKEGKALYAKRKSTVEPVFGIIKNVMGFRSFLCRGFERVQHEWNLITTAFNIKRLYQLSKLQAIG